MLYFGEMNETRITNMRHCADCVLDPQLVAGCLTELGFEELLARNLFVVDGLASDAPKDVGVLIRGDEFSDGVNILACS